eukprot:13685734-Alexandrium_andersonii.AAC.1
MLPAEPTRAECLPGPDEAAGGPPGVSVEGRADRPARPTSPSVRSKRMCLPIQRPWDNAPVNDPA